VDYFVDFGKPKYPLKSLKLLRIDSKDGYKIESKLGKNVIKFAIPKHLENSNLDADSRKKQFEEALIAWMTNKLDIEIVMGECLMTNKRDNFIHLHAHTSIGSMQDAMTDVSKMFERAAELGQSALAITDHGTMAAIFDAVKAAKKHGVKYIPGIEAYFVDDVKEPKQKRRHIVLLAKNEIGYKNLLSLNYKGFLNYQFVAILGKVFPKIDWSLLKEHHEGIICLTACGSGLISRQMFVHDEEGEWLVDQCDCNALDVASRLKEIFGDDLYLEVQPHNLKVFKRNRKTGELELSKKGEPIVVVDQNHINHKLAEIAKQLDINLVSTADIHYLEKEDAAIHDMLMAINEKAPLSDKTRHRYEVEEFYFKDRATVFNHFATNFSRKFAETVCNNTVEIANKCANPDYLDVTEIRFPKFDVTAESDYAAFQEWWQSQSFYEDIPEDHAFMRYRCQESFNQKYGHLQNGEKKKYFERLKTELRVLEKHNFSSYMLIVADFIEKAKDQGILVGPGRGSVGGSLVGNLLGIHMVDPIKYGLLFERFHNAEKTSFPDIDSDFSPDGRDWVEEYIVNKYGKEKVAHVSNLSTMTPKVVIKDIARSLELGGSKTAAFKIANQITGAVPDNAKTFDEALLNSKELRNAVAKYPELEKYGRKLVGLEKAYATHAAGIVIGDIDLSTYVPLRLDKNGTVSVQYEKNRCEAVGLIKMDLLGLEHLKILGNTIKNARSLGLDCPDPEDMPLDDEDVWNEISKGKTLCVFQMGSPHMRTLCKQIKPRNIEDLSLVNALGRPSAAQSRNSYIARRDGKERVTYKYECLREALKETLGICVYEEQLAKLANHVAGWDLNKADGLRKLTKLKEKGKELAAKLKEDFVQDAMKHSGLKQKEAVDIWESIIEPFSGYGFNKAHGIFYSLNGYHTAYYKYHFPACFMAAVLKSEVEKASSPSRDANIRAYKREAKRMGLIIKAPGVNNSGHSFTVSDRKTLVTGLEAIKGVGTSAVQNILETRVQHKFKSFADFLYRTNSRLIRKDVIQALSKAGCFDNLNISRKAAHDLYQDIRTKANKYGNENLKQGKDHWDCLNGFEFQNEELYKEWDKKTLLEGEGETLGEYLSGDLNDLHGGFFTGENIVPLAKLKILPNGFTMRTEAIVMDVAQQKLKRGKNAGRSFGKCTISDINGDNASITIWPEQWSKYKSKFAIGNPIRMVCKVNEYAGNNSLILERIEN